MRSVVLCAKIQDIMFYATEGIFESFMNTLPKVNLSFFTDLG